MGSIKTKDESNRQWSYSINKSLALPSLHLQPPSTHWQSLQAVLLVPYHHTI